MTSPEWRLCMLWDAQMTSLCWNAQKTVPRFWTPADFAKIDAARGAGHNFSWLLDADAKDRVER